MINRNLLPLLKSKLKDKKVMIVNGARQVGKTTLLKTLTSTFEKVTWWNGDESDIRKMLENPTSSNLKSLLGNTEMLVIDEAQRIENIGILLKLMHDQIPSVKVIASGSSAFELANRINEPLTGRKWEFTLFPLSFVEMAQETDTMTEKRLLQHRLVFGYYPDVVNNPGNEESILKQLADSYLYKDILVWQRISKPEKLERLLQALAFQVGQQVSYTELGQLTGLNHETIENYISLLEKAFIIYRLPAFSRNMRNELKKSRKIYFTDNGIRNAVINQFNPIGLRNDVGALWENFLMTERLKHISYNRINCNRYFWRNHAQNEIDYLEERNGELSAFEFKHSEKEFKFPKSFVESYKPSVMKTIHQENFIEFIGI
jgi:predicted AAA+ superfamily ATPase